jgi:two-component system, NarL family, sensor histidine kinase UhpB
VGDRSRYVPLFWRLFIPNACVLAAACVVLIIEPANGRIPALVGGLAVMVAVNLVLMRRATGPLTRLIATMRDVDPLQPGQRTSAAGPPSEVTVLSGAFNEMLDRIETERRESARRELLAQEAERRRVAAELHDEIGQTLTAITIQAERAAESDPELAAEALRQVADSVRESLDEVRRIARELRPEALDDLGLVNALIALCTRIGAHDGFKVRRELQGKLPALSPDVELVIYRIAQEGLTNALRHSGGSSATLSLAADAETLTLRVTDDGNGMPARLTSGTAGIAGMRERALLVGGRLSIESAPGRGTEVRLSIPVDEAGA